MNILADENFALLQPLFGSLGSIRTSPGREIDADVIGDADVLLVRSVTRVTPDLLRGSNVRFVGSATIGTDHLDVEGLRAAGIATANAPGCNARSVVEYDLAALSHFYRMGRLDWDRALFGVVGLGNVGGAVATILQDLGLRVIGCDPFVRRTSLEQVGIDTLLARADVVLLHAPMTATGPHPTRHLLDAARLRGMKPGALLLNAGRGGVINNEALLAHVSEFPGRLGGLGLDVWEGEPDILPDLVAMADIATPHVAGYSQEGKWRGSWQVAVALRKFLGLEPPEEWETIRNRQKAPDLPLPDPGPGGSFWDHLDVWMQAICPVMRDTAALKSLSLQGRSERIAGFDRLRRYYPVRREAAAYAVPASVDAMNPRLRAAGFRSGGPSAG